MKRESVSLYDRSGDTVATFYSVKREKDKLVLDARALDAIRMEMVVTPAQVSKIVRMLFCWQVISFMLLLPYFALSRLTSREHHEQ